MEFDKSKFIGQYKEETREHLQNLNEGLLKLEKSPQDKGLLESMMREAHTIKGSSTMMGYKRIADVAHEMESGLQSALDGKNQTLVKVFNRRALEVDEIADQLLSFTEALRLTPGR